MEARDRCGINFIFCKNPSCNKTSCYYCHLECKVECEYFDEEMEDIIMQHFECALNGLIKSKIDEAIEAGSTVCCPYCDTGGRKDEDTCTHMTCIKCGNSYCYVCGLSCKDFEESVQTYEDSENFTTHNSAWYSNDKYCPMYLNEIYELDNTWPDSGDDNDLLDFFHRKKILKNLKELFELEDLNLIEELEKKYKWLEKANLNIDQILNEDLTLIKRGNYDD